ncbi:Sporulation related domain-containing protein [Flavobacterium swingsii]|uniref:Sporulation related domain-containing protein n=2 Tax=Flavobacterium swingsii TaxID=498292 RepID=A0A1I0XCN5_9FLAO|nr:Sporulation related domain-containing protein [Flavobacterium swingsii]
MLIKLLFSLVVYNFALMNIADHISQLLYRFQCVTVPGFGAFLAETISANIHESNQTFYPPKKVISFNPHLKNNDGLLANHISVTEKMSYEQATVTIEKAIFSWKSELENNRHLSLKNIGELRLNQENNLVFEPSNHLNYLTASFGLSSFVSPSIKREFSIAKTEEIEEVIYQIPTENRRYLNPYLKYAAVFILSLGATGFGYKSYLNQTEQAETLMVQADVQKEVNAKIQEATFLIDNTVFEAETEKTLPFHIMAGAFRNEKNASRELEDLISKGYNARIFSRNTNGLIPVVYGSFATYTEAQYKMTQIQDSINPAAWLLIEEL